MSFDTDDIDTMDGFGNTQVLFPDLVLSDSSDDEEDYMDDLLNEMNNLTTQYRAEIVIENYNTIIRNMNVDGTHHNSLQCIKDIQDIHREWLVQLIPEYDDNKEVQNLYDLLKKSCEIDHDPPVYDAFNDIKNVLERIIQYFGLNEKYCIECAV